MQDKRRKRIKARLRGTAERPRASVFRSNRSVRVQLIDDSSGVTILGINSAEGKHKGKTEQALAVGKKVAAQAKKEGINKIVFDRSGYRYQGRVKELAEAMRKGGLDF